MSDFLKERFRTVLKQAVDGIEVDVDAEELERMALFAEFVVETNKTFNLTRITSEDEMAVKHFADSLSCLRIEDRPEIECLDVGTGAGFPGIPLAICRPKWKLVLLDSLRKRLDFIERAGVRLGLSNIATLHSRAEDAGQDRAYRERFDLVVSRAVAGLPTLLELCVPLVKVGGKFLAMKGAEADVELETSGRALRLFGCELDKVQRFSLPMAMGDRTIFVFRKISPTPGSYPRRAGIPAKKPLLEETL